MNDRVKVLFLTDFLTATDKYYGEPFSGQDGNWLRKFCGQKGLSHREVAFGCLHKKMPPGGKTEAWWTKKKPEKGGWKRLPTGWLHPEPAAQEERLWAFIREVDPEAIVVMSDPVFQLLGGEGGCATWRGSEMEWAGRRLVPTYPPVWLRMNPALEDVRKSDVLKAIKPKAEVPQRTMIMNPTERDVEDFIMELEAMLQHGPVEIDLDLETIANHITCLGLAYKDDKAICIPFTTNGLLKPRWDAYTEYSIISHLRQILTHPNARVCGQNLFYDFQIIHHHWMFIPNFHFDTMLSHHVHFPWLEKNLAFQTSLYVPHYTYWKDMHRVKKGEVKDED